MNNWRQKRLQEVANRVARKSDDPTRHRCFVSYHLEDDDEVEDFLESFGHVFIPTVMGVTEDDDFVDSEDTDYIMDRIREEHLGNTTVTIVLIGECTWSRKFVDWEIYSSLRDYEDYKPSGLMGITLPSAADLPGKRPPDRLKDNIAGKDRDEGYARWRKYPDSAEQLQDQIDVAFEARTSKRYLIDNTRERRTFNSSCP